jgi:hypothetical protein
MTRIKINDIPEDMTLSLEEIMTAMGGTISPTGMFTAGQISIVQPSKSGFYNVLGYVPSKTDSFKILR